MKVYDYFEELIQCKQIEGSLKRTADATEVSSRSIKRLQKEIVETGEAAF